VIVITIESAPGGSCLENLMPICERTDGSVGCRIGALPL